MLVNEVYGSSINNLFVWITLPVWYDIDLSHVLSPTTCRHFPLLPLLHILLVDHEYFMLILLYLLMFVADDF